MLLIPGFLSGDWSLTVLFNWLERLGYKAHLSGILFNEQLVDRALRLDHKTVFAILSWLMFGALLTARKVSGWRGRAALRWVLASFVALLLAYVGSRFVLEVLLHRAVV